MFFCFVTFCFVSLKVSGSEMCIQLLKGFEETIKEIGLLIRNPQI